MGRPNKAINIETIINEPEEVGIGLVNKVRAKKMFVPGYTKNEDPTHLTKSFLGQAALCGEYPIDYIGDSPSNKWCKKCLEIADDPTGSGT